MRNIISLYEYLHDLSETFDDDKYVLMSMLSYAFVFARRVSLSSDSCYRCSCSMIDVEYTIFDSLICAERGRCGESIFLVRLAALRIENIISRCNNGKVDKG